MTSPVIIFPIDSIPLGLSYSDWSIRWWQWLCSIPKSSNPAFDDTGDLMYMGQANTEVTFLCQTIEGVEKTPKRINILPRSRLFFMPIINWISIYGHDGDDDIQMMKLAIDRMNVIDNLQLRINNFVIKKNLKGFRVMSSYFDMDFPKENIFEIESGKKKCISDGYWIFFSFAGDKLDLNTESSCSSGLTKIRVNYLLR